MGRTGCRCGLGGEDQTGELAKKGFPKPLGNNLCATSVHGVRCCLGIKKEES
jgi:hypothetical protein